MRGKKHQNCKKKCKKLPNCHNAENYQKNCHFLKIAKIAAAILRRDSTLPNEEDKCKVVKNILIRNVSEYTISNLY